MKKSWIPIINAVGCFVLLGVVAMQWKQNEQHRAAYRSLQLHAHVVTEQRDEALSRNEALTVDLAELKKALMETQKAADEAALQKKLLAEELAQTKLLFDQAVAERDALREQVPKWEEAIKKRDEALLERDKAIAELRKRLEQAIAEIKKAAAR
jgi:chromosome segregation ATPase